MLGTVVSGRGKLTVVFEWHCTCMVPTLGLEPWSAPPQNHVVLKSPSATTSLLFSIARCQGGDFQDHGSEGVQTMVQDHGFARVGTMQVQAIMPPSIQASSDMRSIAAGPLSGGGGAVADGRNPVCLDVLGMCTGVLQEGLRGPEKSRDN